MSKRTFQGQNDGAAPAQDYNQSVLDTPKHGVSNTKPGKDHPENDGDYDHKAMLKSPTRTGLQKK
jgi:hypothetical protein